MATIPSGRLRTALCPLADQIEADIASGILPPGAKLPPQRDLAYDIKVTIGTIGRAYALVRERGLVSGEVGRGTMSCRSRRTANDGRDRIVSAFSGTACPSRPPASCASTRPPPRMWGIRPDRTFRRARVRDYRDEISSYKPASFRNAGRKRARKWLSNATWQPTIDCIVPVLGAHAGIMSVIPRHLAAGRLHRLRGADLSAGIARRIHDGAAHCYRRLRRGRHPADDLERVCAQKHPKAIFLMPSAQNPTGHVTLSVSGARRLRKSRGRIMSG